MIYYVDTSILVAYYCPEVLSDKVETFLSSLETTAISVLTEIEFLAVISKKLRNKELTKTKVSQILKYFRTHLENDHYQKIDMKNDYYMQARQWLGDHIALSTIDALHLAVAALENIPIITADKKLANVGAKVYQNIELLQS